VPYFLVGGTALGFGRGDEVVPVAELPRTELWLAIPRLEISTPAVFGALPPPRQLPLAPALLAAVAAGETLALEHLRAASNDLEAVVLERWPEVRGVYDALVQSGADVVRLSGSGATVLAIFRDSPNREVLRACLPPGCRLEQVESLDRPTLRRLRRVR
jgi:4-diphosphocytidyl-2-C-methyl-D-erythritol kinase